MIVISERIKDLFYEKLQNYLENGVFETRTKIISTEVFYDININDEQARQVTTRKTETTTIRKETPPWVFKLIAESLRLESLIKVAEANGYELTLKNPELYTKKLAEFTDINTESSEADQAVISDEIIEQLKQKVLFGA